MQSDTLLEQQTCSHCNKAITRTAPDYPWFHTLTGSENCHPTTKAEPVRYTFDAFSEDALAIQQGGTDKFHLIRLRYDLDDEDGNVSASIVEFRRIIDIVVEAIDRSQTP